MGSVSPLSTTDADWHRVSGLEDLADGGVCVARVGSRTIALCRVGARYAALDGRCPHMGGPLGEGTIEDGRLVCPWHGREYDPATGSCAGYEESVAVYPVEVRADGVYVRLQPGTN